MRSQWECLCMNIGQWQGQFIKLSPVGDIISAEPSLTSLQLSGDGQTMYQTIQVGARVRHLEYRSLARSVLFFENGAFSQGSTQFAPLGEFGAEFGFIHHRQRLRLVILYHQGQLSEITLIPEHLSDSPAITPAPITPAELSHHWSGEGTILFPDGRNPEAESITNCCLPAQDGLHLPYHSTIVAPKCLSPRSPFQLEVWWLAEPQLLYRMVRTYDYLGGWQDLRLYTLAQA